VAISLSLTNDNFSVFGNDNINLLIIYNLYDNKIIRYFYSFTELTSILILGLGEDTILASNEDGLSLYSLRGLNDKYYSKSITNPLFAPEAIANKHKLILPHSTLSISSIQLIKKNTQNNKIYTITNDGIIIFEYIENSEILLKKHNEVNIRASKVIDLNYSKTTKIYDVLYILTNSELLKIKITGKNDYEINSISNENITAFDVSDTGYIIMILNDMTIKIIDENHFAVIFQTVISDVSPHTMVDRVYWSNLICKAENNKLVRRNLMANFYLINTKNEFFIFDLSQKAKSDVKVNFLYFRNPRRKLRWESKRN
jgi:hypothetical protein